MNVKLRPPATALTGFARGERAERVQVRRHAARLEAAHRHLGRVPAERGDVGLDPGQRLELVLEARVSHRRVLADAQETCAAPTSQYKTSCGAASSLRAAESC